MKTKIKRHSRSVISVLLAVCMLVSCMTVGLIATDAAMVTDEGSVSASGKYGNGKRYLYIDVTGWDFEIDYVNCRWDNNTDAGNVRGNDIVLVAPNIYRVDLKAAQNEYYGDIGGVYIYVKGQTWHHDKMFRDRDKDTNNCYKPADYTWETYFNLWYGSSDTALNDKVFLAPGGIDFPLTTSNTFINVVNAAYDSWNSAGSVWNSSDKIGDMIDSDDDIIFKEKKDQSSTTYYALIRAKNSAAAKYSQVLTYSKDDKQLTIESTAPPTYNITVNDQNDCTIRAEHGGVSKRNGETFTGLFEDDTVNITVTPKNSSDKVTAISATGEGNTVTPVVDNGNGTYRATLTVKATGEISAAIGAKSSYTVNYSVAAAPAGHGNVSAKLQDGTPVSSGTSVLEGTKVIFTATPEDGYGFAGWIGTFSTLLSPYTATISENTSVVASFQLDGYNLYYKDGTAAVNMTEMDNGWYVSSAKITNDKLFTLFRTGNSTYVDSENGDNVYEFKSDWLGPDKNLKWISTVPSGNGQFYKTTADDQYLLYDPFSNTLWVTTEPDGLFGTYDVYIKNGTIRDASGTTGYSSDYGTAELLAADAAGSETTSGVTSASAYDGRAQKVTLTADQIREGVKLTIKATVNADYKTKYYVKGFDVNGGLTRGLTEQEFYEDTAGGHSKGDKKLADDYDDDFSKARVPVDTPWSDFTLELSAEMFPDGKIEITPIYFPLCNKSTDFVRFYAYDFTDDVKRDWGGSLAVYPYIRDKYFPYGYYPGQLMAFEDGVYYADIPASYTYTPDGGEETTIPIQGLTMNNYVWDSVHYDLFFGSDQAGNNRQTYDYDEFAIINTILKKDNSDEDIIFSFKYKTKENSTRANSNLGESTYYKNSATNDPSAAKDYRNGFSEIDVTDSQYHWEELTDFYHHRVDIFGETVDDVGNEKADYNPIRIVSNGYDDNKVGYYATAWALYMPVDADDQPVWVGPYDHYQLFEVMGGQGRSARDYPGESYLIDPKYENRIKLKYGVSDPTVVSARRAALKQQMIENGETDLDGNVITVDTSDDKINWPDHILDCEKVPVMITYEYNIKSDMSNIDTGDHQMAYRSDGRWYFSKSDQLIKSNVIVEVANSKKGPFVRDYFQEGGVDYKSGQPPYYPQYNAGLTTGVKAYFENNNQIDKDGVSYTNVNGYTEAYALSDGKQEHDFHLKAEEDPDGNYLFVGWYRLTDSGTGIGYTYAGDDPQLEVEAKTNDVYVARFVKVPSGNLMVSHTLKADSPGQGEADCTASVVVYTLDGSGNEVIVDNTSYPATTSNIKVTSKYIKYDEHATNTTAKWLKITIQTTSNPAGKWAFDKFWDKDGSGNYRELANTTLYTVDGSANQRVIRVKINDLFAVVDGDAVQQVKQLPFFSSIKRPTIAYHMKYTYTSTQYGNQSYSVDGNFSESDFENYLEWSDEVPLSDSAGGAGVRTTGAWYKYKDNKMAEFFALHCPHESNLHSDLSWNYPTAITNNADHQPSYYKSGAQITTYISASSAPNTIQRVQFIFPYWCRSTDDGTFAYTKGHEGEKVYMLEDTDESYVVDYNAEQDPSTHQLVDVRYSKYLNVTNEYYTPYYLNKQKVVHDNAAPVYVSAVPVIYAKDGEGNYTVPKFFQYWSVKTVPADVSSGAHDPAEELKYREYEVTKCYHTEFNLNTYQDYIVEAVYGDVPSKRVHSTTATITSLDQSRNQWNNNDKGTYKYDDRVGDRIFANFIIGFDRVDKLNLRTVSGNQADYFKTGMLIDRIEKISVANGYLEDSSDPAAWTTKSEKEYFAKYSGLDAGATAEQLEAADNGKEDAIAVIRANIGGSTANFTADYKTHNYANSNITITNLDNKNRIEFTKAFPNWNATRNENTGRKDYVYRAYAYMVDYQVLDASNHVLTYDSSAKCYYYLTDPNNSNTRVDVPVANTHKGDIMEITISNPVYFTIYDIASITNDIGQSTDNGSAITTN